MAQWTFLQKRGFASNHAPGVIADAIVQHLGYPVDPLGPIAEGVHLREHGPSRIVIAHGNRLETFWTLTIELTARGTGTAATVAFDRDDTQMPRAAGSYYARYACTNTAMETLRGLWVFLDRTSATFKNWASSDPQSTIR